MKEQGQASNTREAARRRAIEHCAQILMNELTLQIDDSENSTSKEGLHSSASMELLDAPFARLSMQTHLHMHTIVVMCVFLIPVHLGSQRSWQRNTFSLEICTLPVC